MLYQKKMINWQLEIILCNIFTSTVIKFPRKPSKTHSTYLARVYQVLRCTRFLVRPAAASAGWSPTAARGTTPAPSPVDRVLQRAAFRVRLRVVHLKADLLEQWTYNRTTS